MDDVEIRVAVFADMDAVLPLIAAFHVEERVETTAEARREAVAFLVANPVIGELWLIERAGALMGYVSLSFGFALEFNGRDAFIDEIYVSPAARGAGIGRMTLARVQADLAARGIKALHLEVHTENDRAAKLYAKAGFELRDHYHLMSARLGGKRT